MKILIAPPRHAIEIWFRDGPPEGRASPMSTMEAEGVELRLSGHVVPPELISVHFTRHRFHLPFRFQDWFTLGSFRISYRAEPHFFFVAFEEFDAGRTPSVQVHRGLIIHLRGGGIVRQGPTGARRVQHRHRGPAGAGVRLGAHRSDGRRSSQVKRVPRKRAGGAEGESDRCPA